MWVSYSREPAAQRADLSGWVVWARALYEHSQSRPSANMLLKAATIMHIAANKSKMSYGLATEERAGRAVRRSLWLGRLGESSI